MRGSCQGGARSAGKGLRGAAARGLSSRAVPGQDLAEAPVTLYGEEERPLGEVSSVRSLEDGTRIELEPFDPTTSMEVRESLSESLQETDLKVYFDAACGKLVVVPRSFRSEAGRGATKTKTRRGVVRV